MEKLFSTIEQANKFPALSDRYQFLSTKQAIQTIEGLGYQLSSVQEARTRKEERKGFQKHILRFRLPEHMGRGNLQALKDTNKEFPEIVYIGSHDGSAATRIMAGFFRVVCSNGLISGSINDEMRIKHVVRKNVDPYKELEETLKIVAGKARDLSDVVERWKAKQVNDAAIEHLVYKALDARLAESSLNHEQVKLEAIDIYRMQRAKRADDSSSDLWTAFNRVQETAVRSPIRVEVLTGEHAGEAKTLKVVRSIDGLVRINQALWNAAESIAA